MAAELPAERLGGVLLTDERSASEAVMILWLEPDVQSSLYAVAGQHIIIGAMHVSQGAGGLQFDSTSRPVLTGPGGQRAPGVEPLGADLADVIGKVKTHLKSRQGAAAALAPLADQFGFFVFDKGGIPAGQGWSLDYAGRTYVIAPAGGANPDTIVAG